MTLLERKAAFIELGRKIANLSPTEMAYLAAEAGAENAWFDFANVQLALSGIAHMLSEQSLHNWLTNYTSTSGHSKKVGVVMAGNLPAVGFHDFMTVLLAGHILLAKPSKDDTFLIKWLSKALIEIEPRFKDFIVFTERMNDADAVIATGSDNTARYFEYYFRNTPHIIRKNRSSVAVLNGTETQEELMPLGNDLFSYYGLGCRNVSKIWLPEDVEIENIIRALEPWHGILNHHKYQNNYDYNKSIYLVNRVPHFDSGYALFTESKELVSPISVVYYEYYKQLEEVNTALKLHAEKIQVIVSKSGWYTGSISFGKSQQPDVWQYADNIDTLSFLGLLH